MRCHLNKFFCIKIFFNNYFWNLVFLEAQYLAINSIAVTQKKRVESTSSR